VRYAVLGAGGIGGLLAAALARAGREVVMLLRWEALGRYGGRLPVESVVLGNFEVEVPGVPALPDEVDVLWIGTTAMHLPAAWGLRRRMLSAMRSSRRTLATAQPVTVRL